MCVCSFVCVRENLAFLLSFLKFKYYLSSVLQKILPLDETLFKIGIVFNLLQFCFPLVCT